MPKKTGAFAGVQVEFPPAEVVLGKVLPAIVFRPSGTFPGPTGKYNPPMDISGLGIFLRSSVISYATN